VPALGEEAAVGLITILRRQKFLNRKELQEK
jgi:hypothetical protein